MKKKSMMFAAAFEAALSVGALERPGDLVWGGREEHPAVVNPVVSADVGGSVMSLRGEWEFLAQPMAKPIHYGGPWGPKLYRAGQEWPGARKIEVPGCWEAQGVGEQGMSESWDPKWDNSEKPIRSKYMGDGWYRRKVAIPASWEGRRIWLKVGGVKSRGWFWVNDGEVALVDNFCGTCKYEITDLVKPGEEALVVAQVNNALPSRRGCVSGMHKWGGFYRDVEIEATPQTFVDDAWVRGLFDERAAEAHVAVSGGMEGLSVRFTVDGKSVEAAAGCGETVLKLPLAEFRPWSPEHPNLYTGVVELVEGGKTVHSRMERFGVRKFEVCGKEFRLNGRPFYVRGFGDDAVYPVSGISPADRDVHRRHLGKAKAAGFNFVRLHTHCELPEYFDAADEMGIMIQPELPYYSDVTAEGFRFDPAGDAEELWRNYRRHPSFAVYSMGNEGSFGKALDAKLHAFIKAMDPDRLKINQDSNLPEMNPPEAADYLGGPIKMWERGTVDPDRPFVTHEYLNLCVKADPRIEGMYTGAWLPPSTRDARDGWLAKFGLGQDWRDRLQDAQHALQSVWQKRGIECARIDPYCDGYIFWTIIDVVVWNKNAEAYSAQGLFDPFWNDKPKGFTASGFAAFNSPSCVLADVSPAQSVFVAGESFRSDVFLAHYGDAPMNGAEVKWRLGTASRTLAEGSVAAGDQPVGAVRKVASVNVDVPAVERPEKVSYSVEIGGVRNSWDMWVFPKGPSLAEIRAEAKRRGVVIAKGGSAEAERALAEGMPLISVDGTGGKPNVSLGWWWMGRQVGTAIRPHPALGAFPHDGALTPLLFRILKCGKELPAPEVDQKDMVIVGEGGDRCYLYLAVRRIGGSQVVECHGIDVLSDLPEANALLASFVDYLARGS